MNDETESTTPPELELSIPGVQPETIVLNGKRYMLLNPRLTEEDRHDIEDTLRRYAKGAAREKALREAGF